MVKLEQDLYSNINIMGKFMNYKNTLLGIMLALSLLPTKSFSESISNNDNSQNFKLYISGQYKPGVPKFNNFSAKETNVKTQKLLGLLSGTSRKIDKYKDFSNTYIPDFQDSSTGFGAAVGYISYKGIRFEIESSYEEFQVNIHDNCEGTIEPCRYFALARSVGRRGWPDQNNYTVMKNTGLSMTSVMFNGCYNIMSNKLEISPYICIGIGGDFIDFFDSTHIKLAYQGKLGISYSLLPDVTLFVDGYYHRIANNQFKNLNVLQPVELKYEPKITSATATMNVTYFGGEVGIRFIFNS
ncbi:P44/Msp2 family outer membrane protein [Ehrlichia ruminantium]|uniref:Map1-related protein n=3 Tax=Ehrlichia ruminantium TaxID=779 RepID=A0A0H3M9H4_EHRRW|nr:P44/Msp2 family outer membrane protein [Ehrlichia ruminantium]KYW93869.1 P44/Msp2 family outer membrane protein [Ehrlichia ruminantium]QLK50954.1 P44/Msp2 family outer membrane protein [Ehrlichia ruminantium]QLK51876.1 P44/Msp2 family outer membrane protein [Ehrlichia ruminantium]QLK53717.1 P44/Msp2 family outer membrane protein [Ehrlichia ruminantium]QLK55553.1 P44/Msp2 family outer membrane protein [Ehrlichia ruminantium]